MAAIPDQGMPGDDLPAEPAQADLLNAYSAGYTHDDATAELGADPPRPDIGEIWGGTHPADATWTQPAEPGGDNDPTKLDTNVRSQIDQVAESGLGVGSIEGVGLRAAGLGVKTTTAELTGAMSKVDLAVEHAIGDTSAVGKVVGNTWVRRTAAGVVAQQVFFPSKLLPLSGSGAQ